MSELDDVMLAAHAEVDAIMGTKSMVCDGQTFNVVWNDYSGESDGVYGGLETNVRATAIAQPADVTSPTTLRNKRCTVGGVSFRVLDVAAGDVAITFTLCDPSESR